MRFIQTCNQQQQQKWVRDTTRNCPDTMTTEVRLLTIAWIAADEMILLRRNFTLKTQYNALSMQNTESKTMEETEFVHGMCIWGTRTHTHTDVRALGGQFKLITLSDSMSVCPLCGGGFCWCLLVKLPNRQYYLVRCAWMRECERICWGFSFSVMTTQPLMRSAVLDALIASSYTETVKLNEIFWRKTSYVQVQACVHHVMRYFATHILIIA